MIFCLEKKKPAVKVSSCIISLPEFTNSFVSQFQISLINKKIIKIYDKHGICLKTRCISNILEVQLLYLFGSETAIAYTCICNR